MTTKPEDDFTTEPPDDSGHDVLPAEIPHEIAHWRILKYVKQGTFGHICIVQFGEDGTFGILKLPKQENEKNAERHLTAEEKALIDLSHENVVRYLGSGKFQPDPKRQPERLRSYLLLEVVPGSISFAELAHPPEPTRPPTTSPNDKETKALRKSLTRRLDLFRQLCLTVDFMHKRRWLHNDLASRHALIVFNESRVARLKLIDFGLARRMDGSVYLNADGAIQGSEGYRDPDNSRLDPRSDVYSLGIILKELIDGKKPDANGKLDFAGFVTSHALRERIQPSDVPGLTAKRKWHDGEELKQIIERAVAERDIRYQSALELCDDLDAYLRKRAKSFDSNLRRLTDHLKNMRRMVSPLNFAGGFFCSLILAASYVIIAIWPHYQDSKDGLERSVVKIRTLETSLLAADDDRESSRRERYGRSIRRAELFRRQDNIPSAFHELAECEQQYRGWEWYYLASTSLGEQTVYGRCETGFQSCADVKSGNEVFLLAGGRDGSIWCWNGKTPATMKFRYWVKHHNGPVRQIVQRRAQTEAYSVGEDGTLANWSIESGKELLKSVNLMPPLPPQSSGSAAVRSRTFVILDDIECVCSWDYGPRSEPCFQNYSGERNDKWTDALKKTVGGDSVQWNWLSMDGRIVLASRNVMKDRAIRFYIPNKDKFVVERPDEEAWKLKVSDDVTLGESLFSTRSGFCCLPQHNRIAFYLNQDCIRCPITSCNLSDGKATRACLGHFGSLTSLAPTNDRLGFLSTSLDGTIRRWNCDTHLPQVRLTLKPKFLKPFGVRRLEFSGDSRRAMLTIEPLHVELKSAEPTQKDTRSDCGLFVVSLADAISGQLNDSVRLEWPDSKQVAEICGCGIAQDGRSVLCSFRPQTKTGPGPLETWCWTLGTSAITEKSRCEKVLIDRSPANVDIVSFSADLSRIAIVGGTKAKPTIHVFARTPSARLTYADVQIQAPDIGGSLTSVAAVRFSPDARRLVAAAQFDRPGPKSYVCSWNLDDGTCNLYATVDGAAEFHSLGFDRSGELIAAGTTKAHVQFFNLQGESMPFKPPKLDRFDSITCVDFSTEPADRTRLVTAGNDSVDISCPRSGEKLLSFGVNGFVGSTCWSPDGEWLAVAHGSSATVSLYRANQSAALAGQIRYLDLLQRDPLRYTAESIVRQDSGSLDPEMFATWENDPQLLINRAEEIITQVEMRMAPGLRLNAVDRSFLEIAQKLIDQIDVGRFGDEAITAPVAKLNTRMKALNSHKIEQATR